MQPTFTIYWKRMTRSCKHFFLTLLALIILFGFDLLIDQTVEAQAGTPWEVLAEINGYRAANGLPPLVENQALTIAAQNHVNWMAETGEYSHTGANGSTAADRALAAGYGGGLSVRVTENWARGHGLTASGVVYDMWLPSGIHNSQMLTSFYNEFGAGVAVDRDGMTVYVVKFGIVLGGTIPQQPAQPQAPSSAPTLSPGEYIQPIITAEPYFDGSVIHIVQFGQTLWAIADAYGIPLEDLLAQNGLLEDSEIFPNQELLIIPATIKVQGTEPISNTKEVNNTPTPRPSRTPTKIPSPTPTRMGVTPTQQAPSPENTLWKTIFNANPLWIGVGLVVISLIGIGVELVRSSRLR